MPGRVVYISGTAGHRVHSRDVAFIFSCNYVSNIPGSPVPFESEEPGNGAMILPIPLKCLK